MSMETEKMFKALHEFIDSESDENRSEEDVQNLIQEFMAQYNGSLPQPVTPETAETSDDYMDLVYSVSNEKDKLKYAKMALKLDPHNFDAERAVLGLKAKDMTKLVQDYARSIQKATKYMEDEGYFEEDMGYFWGVLETRPYMRLLEGYVGVLLECGMIGRAKEQCREMLRLCEGDNLGMRFRLMHIYAYFEEEEEALALYKQFGEYEESEMLLPLSILFYKKGDFTKSKQYLRKLNRANKDLKRFLRLSLGEGNKEFEEFNLDGGYRPGTIEELMIMAQDNGFLYDYAFLYMDWALKQVKQFK